MFIEILPRARLLMGAVSGKEEIRSDGDTHQHEAQESLVANLEALAVYVLRW